MFENSPGIMQQWATATAGPSRRALRNVCIGPTWFIEKPADCEGLLWTYTATEHRLVSWLPLPSCFISFILKLSSTLSTVLPHIIINRSPRNAREKQDKVIFLLSPDGFSEFLTITWGVRGGAACFFHPTTSFSPPSRCECPHLLAFSA